VSDDGGYSGSEVTAIDEIEIYDYDEYLELYGDLPLGGIEESEYDDAEYDDGGTFYGEGEND